MSAFIESLRTNAILRALVANTVVWLIGICVLIGTGVPSRGNRAEGPTAKGQLDGRIAAKLAPQNRDAKPAAAPEAKAAPKAEQAPKAGAAQNPEALPPLPSSNPPPMPVTEVGPRVKPMPPLAPKPPPSPNAVSTIVIGAAVKAPTANAIEKAPLPVNQMKQEEIEAVAKQYFGWTAEEGISIRLDFSDVTAAQLNRIVSGHLLRSEESLDWKFRRADGELSRMSDLPKGKLFGDLPHHKWPEGVKVETNTLYGPGARLEVKLVLADAAAVEMFRQLADEVKQRGAAPKQDFVFKLSATDHDQGVKIELIPTTNLR